MKILLDTSVLLAACGSPHGGSMAVIRQSPMNGWRLLTSPYIWEEVARNLRRASSLATAAWAAVNPRLADVSDVLAIDHIVVFPTTKDRPVLFTAYAHADVLLTLDQADFIRPLGSTFYHLQIRTPGQFLQQTYLDGHR